MLLDPRAYRLNDLLRRQITATTWDHDWLALELRVAGESLLPADGFWRPSHLSLFGRDPLSELQVSQDSFTTTDGTQVVTLLLRNPSDNSLAVEIIAHNLARGTHRCLPPLDDLYLQLPAGALAQRTFTQSLAPDTETALKHATHWYFDSHPALAHTQLLDNWQQQECLLFDCSDPWLTRLVAHCQALRWHGISPPPLPLANEGAVRESFLNGNFDAPRDDCPAWDTAVIERLVGVSLSEVTLTISPDNFLGLSSFCLQGFQGTTIVWDDPAHPEDAFGDGDKGLTIYLGRARVHNQPTLTPCCVTLARERGFPAVPARF
jgi:hypothetical protein